MSNPFFNAGIGILQGQTPSRTRPNFAANAMGGLQNAMANRTSIQNQSALETERERQKIEYEQKQEQILAEKEFLASINAGTGQPTTTSLSPSGLPNIPPTGPPNTPPTEQFGGIPPIPGQGEIQQRTTTPTQQYVSKLNQRLAQIKNELESGKIPSISRYKELLVDREKVEKDIYEAIKPQDSPTSVLEFEYAKTNDLFPGTLQEWMQAKKDGMEIVSDGKGGFRFSTNVTNDDIDRKNANIVSTIEEGNTMLSAVAGVIDAYENSDMPITGLFSIPASIISSTPQGIVRSYTRTLQSGVALDAIKGLKALSATGATGFGALNEAELQLLLDHVGSLNPDEDDPEVFMQTVYRIEAQYERVMKGILSTLTLDEVSDLGLQPLIDEYRARQSAGNANTPPAGNANTPPAAKTIKFGDNR